MWFGFRKQADYIWTTQSPFTTHTHTDDDEHQPVEKLLATTFDVKSLLNMKISHIKNTTNVAIFEPMFSASKIVIVSSSGLTCR